MRTTEQIISEIKDFVNKSKPFRFYNRVNDLLNELSLTLTEETVVEEVVIEEETVVEEPVEEIVVPKKRPRKTPIK
jgi:hypothetical protein